MWQLPMDYFDVKFGDNSICYNGVTLFFHCHVIFNDDIIKNIGC